MIGVRIPGRPDLGAKQAKGLKRFCLFMRKAKDLVLACSRWLLKKAARWLGRIWSRLQTSTKAVHIGSKSCADEIADVSMTRPHVVLVGAGASRAACPNGDRHGRFLPVMKDFYQVPNIGSLLKAAGFDPHANFETIYSQIAADPALVDLCRALEDTVFQYFSSLELPTAATIYDHLIVSLRPKDVIATFNWDPFLIQAARRHRYIGEMPRLLFLHGNVAHGFCVRDRVSGVRGARCSQCGEPFAPDRLLFPIEKKDYESDPSISAGWEGLRYALKHAFMFTIFGYGAPSSDASAVALLSSAWGEPSRRSLEQTEIIDIRSAGELRAVWKRFIHTHHYEIHASFYDSWLAMHPRRSGEAFTSQYLDAEFIEDNPLPSRASLSELHDWLQPLLSAEKAK